MASPQTALGSAFTYRGQLKSGGTPINATCDIAFRLFDAGSGGFQFGGTLTQTVAITASLFTVDLDFGAGAFAGSARWLDLAVRCPAGSGAYTALSPRQEVTAVPNALFASNADLLDGRDSTAFVDLSSAQNITGVKTFASGVKFPDGTSMNTAPYRTTLSGPGGATIVDSAGGAGEYSSLVIGADGLGLVSYYGNGLKVLHCGNPACSGGNSTRVVDASTTSGISTSIAIGADGLGLIWYGESSNGTLRVAHCKDTACNEFYTNNTTITGSDPAVTIGTDGLGLVSFYDHSAADLRLLHCDHVTCFDRTGPYAPITLDSAGSVGRFSSITIGADGLGLISYFDSTNARVKALHCGNTNCDSGNTITILDTTGQPGSDTSITIGSDGLGLISYYDVANGDLKVLHCGNLVCNSGNSVATVDDPGDVGSNSSIAIGADGLAMISYYDASNQNLKALHCGNSICSSGNISITLDIDYRFIGLANAGFYTSITLGADGLMLISYYEKAHADLKVFHCANVTCSRYVRVGR